MSPVGAIGLQFYAELLKASARSGRAARTQNDVSRWPELREILTKAFAAHDRDHWASVFDGTDACVTHVLSFAECSPDRMSPSGTFYDDAGNKADARAAFSAMRWSSRRLRVSALPTPKPSCGTGYNLPTNWLVGMGPAGEECGMESETR